MSKKKSPAECEAFKQELAIQIEGISKLADTWNVGYAKTKSDLYGVLSDCFEIIKTKFIDASKAEKKLFRQQVIEELTKKNVRVQDNSTVAGLFFRLVFKAGRNRAHSYATVINVADDEGISPADLPAFITSKGGIEEIKRCAVKSVKAVKEKADIDAAKVAVKTELELAAATTPLATVSIAGLSGTYALLLVKPNAAQGTATVVASLSELEKPLLDNLIARIAKVRVKQTESEAIQAKTDEGFLPSVCSANEAQAQKAA